MEPLNQDRGQDRHPLLGFFLLATAVWILAWLPLGLIKGDPDYVLTAISRGTVERQIYQGLLYSGLLLVFLHFWLRHAPARPGRGRLTDFPIYAALGLASALILRAVMVGLGGRAAPHLELDLPTLLIALASAIAVAVVEEAVFRGFLLGRLAAVMPFERAAVMCSALFAAVHLFRPGPLAFRAGYGLGLFLLAMLLARIAWVRQSLSACAGFHAGLIWPNLLDPWPELKASWWSGWQGEPASGALAWLLTGLLWAQWEWWQRGNVEVPPSSSNSPLTPPGGESII